MTRRRTHVEVSADGVRTAYARYLRAQEECRPWTWGPAARRIADLESGRPVAVKFWEIRRFVPGLRLDPHDWVQLVGGDVVLVEPICSADGLHITGWRALA